MVLAAVRANRVIDQVLATLKELFSWSGFEADGESVEQLDHQTGEPAEPLSECGLEG